VEIEESRQGDAALLVVRGALRTPAECAAFDQRLSAMLAEGVKMYAIEARELEAIGSAALRVLLRLDRSLKRAGGKLVFCGLEPSLHDALVMAGFDREFGIAEDPRQVLEQWLGERERAPKPAAAPAVATPVPTPAPAPARAVTQPLAAALADGLPPLRAGLSSKAAVGAGLLRELASALG
jgi:anti-anti-sigma factor